MPEITPMEYFNIIFRWIHVFAGILWIGFLYFFNFVNAYFIETTDADTRKKVVSQLLPRALFFFRWGAMITFLAGLVLLYINYMAPGHGGDFNSGRGSWIMLGVFFGTIMWFNVWFVIWPAQRIIIQSVKTGQPASKELAQRSSWASRINVYLSVPLVFAMLSAGGHFPYAPWYFLLGICLIGWAIVWHVYKVAAKISSKV